MKAVAVSFEYKGEHHSGTLESVHGASGSVWHLSVNKYYWGRLRIAQGRWVFDPTPKNEELKDLADYFGSLVGYQQE